MAFEKLYRNTLKEVFFVTDSGGLYLGGLLSEFYGML